MALIIKDCKTEYRTNPLGIDAVHPRFSWKLESDTDDTYRVKEELLLRAKLEMLCGTPGKSKRPE